MSKTYDKKKLIKSKSYKDVLIASDKKLIDFFPLHKKKLTFNVNDNDKCIEVYNHEKLTLKVNRNIEVQN